MVFVVKKKPVSLLRPEEVIPTEIDGVKTDVYESEIPRSHAVDDSKYRPLVGGGQIEPGGFSPNLVDSATSKLVAAGSGLGEFGTLGCLAITGGANPKVLAITCWHIIASALRGKSTSLTATPVVPKINFGGTNSDNSLVFVTLSLGGKDLQVFYRTSVSDTPTTIAAAVAARIGALGVAGLSATASATTITLTTTAGPLSYNCAVYSQPEANTEADVRASVEGTAISLSGQASKACAAYVTINVGAALPTYGIFVPIAAGDNATKVANSIMKAITDRNLSGVTAIEMDPPSPGDPATVSVSGVQEIECQVSSDIRVGQPTNAFCSKCCKCCDDRIGVVFDARLDLDVALIQLDPAYVEKYRAEIQDIGVVKGVHDITLESSGYPLQKRGRTTGRTDGTLLALDQDGETADSDSFNTPPAWTLLRRHYTGAFTIQGAFSDKGDSGAAVVTKTPNPGDPNNNQIVGILFGGTGTVTWATPILPVLSAFPTLNLTIATATAPGQDVPVPAASAPAAHDAMVAANVESVPAANLADAQQKITAIPAGRRYSELVQRHFPEVQRLINENRRVATAWQRNGGPQIAHGLLQVVQLQKERLPSDINGKPLSRCLAGIQSVFTRYGSPNLAADLTQYGPPLAQLAGLTYPQALDALRNLEMH